MTTRPVIGATFTQLCAMIDERVLAQLRQADEAQKKARPSCLLLSRAYLLMQHQVEWTEPEMAHARACVHCRQVLDNYNMDAVLHDINRRLTEEMDKDPLDRDAIGRLEAEMMAEMKARGLPIEPINFSGATIPKVPGR